MLNKIWFGLFFLGFLVAGATGRIQETTLALFASMENTVKFTLGIVGFLIFWSGMLRIAEEAGFMKMLARILHPVLRRLFPGIPATSPALGAIALSIAANLLGLSNASTPLGIRAMQELNKVNPHPDTVSEPIATYLGIVMGGITLFPSTIISIRAQAGSANPAVVTGPILLATVLGTCAALVVHVIVSRLKNSGKGE